MLHSEAQFLSSWFILRDNKIEILLAFFSYPCPSFTPSIIRTFRSYLLNKNSQTRDNSEMWTLRQVLDKAAP
jgi:hypothetical protein